MRDFHRFAQMLAAGGRVDEKQIVSADHLRQMISDQVPAGNKTAESFFPGFWEAMGWGFGVAVQTDGPHRGRYGWSGGQGTDFFVDPDGTIGILFTQVELGVQMESMLGEFQARIRPVEPSFSGGGPTCSTGMHFGR